MVWHALGACIGDGIPAGHSRAAVAYAGRAESPTLLRAVIRHMHFKIAVDKLDNRIEVRIAINIAEREAVITELPVHEALGIRGEGARRSER